MKHVKVILRQTVATLGEAGQIVSVRPGYARNYLLPQGYAFEATESNLRRLEEEQRRREETARRDVLEAKRRAAALEGVSLTFHARAGEESKLFGSITSGDIADRLGEQGLDFTIDRRDIELDEPIKALGVYSVRIKLHTDVRPEVKVWVVKEE
ncbi:MAG: 50S ribosomal protein L9 [Longimicrobiales bacterium]